MIAERESARTRLHVALVHGPDTEPYVAIGETRGEVLRRLARYMARNAPNLLWPEDAARLEKCLGDGDLEGAVETYFAALDDPGRTVRWERQRLVLRSVRSPRRELRRP